MCVCACVCASVCVCALVCVCVCVCARKIERVSPSLNLCIILGANEQIQTFNESLEAQKIQFCNA